MENNYLNSDSARIIELAKQGNAEAVSEILDYLLITDGMKLKFKDGKLNWKPSNKTFKNMLKKLIMLIGRF